MTPVTWSCATGCDRDITGGADDAQLEVTAGTSLRLLGVTFDRLLHFGAHCSELRKKVRPRIAHLRRMTGRSWGLNERQLRVVANGYVRGALEYAAGAWLPAASTSHLELVDRELRAAARVVTGCTMSTPAHALMAEAGLPTARTRRATLAARMLGTAASLPEGEPLRALADATPTRRLKTTTGWRDRGREALAQGILKRGITNVSIYDLLSWTVSWSYF